MLFAVVFLLSLAVRLPVLLAHQDTYYVFEVHSGTIAQAILDGIDLRIDNLPIIEHTRGNLVLALLALPLYALFGPSLTALKVVPLFWNAAAFGLLALLVARVFGRACGVVAGISLVLLPPAVAKMSTLALFTHLESMLIVAVVALLSFSIARSRGRAGGGLWFGLGLAVGFGGFFHLQALIGSLLLLGLVALSRPRELLGRAGILLLAGAALTSAPSWLFAGGNIEFLTDKTLPEGGAASSGRLGQVASRLSYFVTTFPYMMEFGEFDEPLAVALAAAYTGALLAGCLAGVWFLRRSCGALVFFWRPCGGDERVKAFFWLYPLALMLMFAVARFQLHDAIAAGATYRYFAPLFVSAIVLFSIGAYALLSRARGLGLAAVALIALSAAAGIVRASASGPANRLPHRGERYEWFVRRMRGVESPAGVEILDRVDRGDPRFRSLRFRLGLSRRPLNQAASRQGVRATLNQPPEVRVFEFTDLGRRLAASPPDLKRFVETALADLGGIDRAAVLHGVGLGVVPLRADSKKDAETQYLNKLVRLISTPPRADRRFVAEGFGFRTGDQYDPYSQTQPAALRLFQKLPPAVLADFYRGLGWGYRQRFPNDLADFPEDLPILDHVPDRHASDFMDGLLLRALPAEAAVFLRDAAGDGRGSTTGTDSGAPGAREPEKR